MSNIYRRDPRAEWIARNRLHPQHVPQEPLVLRGPTGLLRKNPHKIGFIGPNGIKRIDRSGASNANQLGRKAAKQIEVELPLHQVDNPDFSILVAVDAVGGRLSSHDRDTLGLAHTLANRGDEKGAVIAVFFDDITEENLETAGIDSLIHYDDKGYKSYNPEQRCADLCELVTTLRPKHILLPDSINGGADLGRRLAAKMHVRPACNVWKVTGDQLICRGGAGKTDITRPLSKLLLVMEECSEPVSDTRHQNMPLSVDVNAKCQLKIQDLGNISVDPNEINLAEAGFILSGGNGITDWPKFHLAAKTLGATEGASRVAVDDGFMPRERQVGATGTWVTAKVYIAVGISGAIQHMQGIGQCHKVVAINSDDSCDMVKRADLSAIGDSSEILDELLNLMQGNTGLSEQGNTEVKYA
ncbi:electron transfer flavoprotein subunit alpha/FixB family protein [uncultured Paraglaciecola sp.]|uniref:electron transfer flavoprotein subunit alpha n=1 Tax=uncultured Paraglaciecola sp. TaxID=1765024 RepID=UPI0025964B66|nr:electron transfer flavoprotein subunit alpha/FixB family protein [uncultured Paraglaciecola sp.]